MVMGAVQSQVACLWRENENSDISFRLVKSYVVKKLFDASNIRVACFVEDKNSKHLRIFTFIYTSPSYN